MPWINNNLKRQGIQLYKQFVYLSKIYPGDRQTVMKRVRDEYYSYQNETDPQEIKKAFNNAKWYLKEIEGTAKVAKYRYMKRNYDDKDQSKQ